MLKQLDNLPQYITKDIFALISSIGQIQAQISLQQRRQKQLLNEEQTTVRDSIGQQNREYSLSEEHNRELRQEKSLLEVMDRGDVDSQLYEARKNNAQLVQTIDHLKALSQDYEREEGQLMRKIEREKQEIKHIIRMSREAVSSVSPDQLGVLRRKAELEKKIADQSKEKEELFKYIRELAGEYRVEKNRNGKLLAQICRMQ